MRNKKAISSITAGIFLILISIVSITIIGVSLNASVLSLSPILSCSDLQINSPLKLKHGCFNSADQRLEITLTRELTDDSNIKNFELSSPLGDWSCNEQCNYGCLILSQGQEKTYLINSKENPKEITLKLNFCNLQKIAIEEC